MTRGYKVSLLTALYFAQGLPFGFFTQTLPVLLRDAQNDLVAALGTLDHELLIVLERSRLLPEAVWATLAEVAVKPT